jgi:hypothetical protein
MDQAFAFFGLLVFALVLWDLTRASVWTASAAALGTVLFVLVKPAALSFVFPMFCVVAVRGAVRLGAVVRQPRDLRRWLAWAAAYLAMMAVLALLWRSPYGQAVAEQYRIGRQGHWIWHVTVIHAVIFTTLVIPLWLLCLLGWYLVRHRRIGMSAWVVACGAATAVWWYVFNVFIAYTTDPRVLVAVLGVGVTCALVILTQDARLSATATTIAAVLFVSNVATAAGARHELQALLGPMARIQQPMPEVGVVPLVERVRAEITKVQQSGKPVDVIAVVNDDFVEYAALNLAMRYSSGDVWSFIQFRPVPWGSTNFDLGRLLQSHWFLTKRTRSAVALPGDTWVSLYAMDELITNPASPLQRYFEKRLEAPIRQPEFGDPGLFAPESPQRMLQEMVTLWYLRNEPPPAQQAQALRWIEPRFRQTPGHAELLSQIGRVQAVATRGNGVDVIDAITAQNIVTAAEPSLRHIVFGGRFRLLGIAQRRSRAGVELELAWESVEDQNLDGTVFVHLLDAKRNVVGQLDYAQDPFKGRVKGGDVWRDVVRVPVEKLEHVETIGLGVQVSSSENLRVDRGPTDWDGRRLSIAVK